MKIHVSELSGRALDWAVAIAIDMDEEIHMHSGFCWINGDDGITMWAPTWKWEQGGSLIAEYNIWLRGPVMESDLCAADFEGDRRCRGFGNTPLIAICRAVVRGKLGEAVDIPDELVE